MMRKGGNAMDSVAVDYELQTTLQKLEKMSCWIMFQGLFNNTI